ncbi:MAG TPA: amino acid permease [Gemmatimonadales bacterium]|nr:amino acid permease [Gemmatimonadales bacterium]
MTERSPSLARVLGFRDLVLIVVGTVIGSGIFLVPGNVIRASGGSVGAALIVWLVGGVLSLLGALTYGELGARKPGAGGLYTYLRDAFGPVVAFLYGWTAFLVIASGSVATLALAGSSYFSQLVPLSPGGAKGFALLVIALVTVINVRGTRGSANVQNWSTGIKVAALLVISAGLLVSGHGFSSGQAIWPAHWNGALISGMGIGMIGVLWAYEGWQYGTFSAGETVDAQRVFPRAIALGTAALIGIYLFANVGYVAALGPAGVAGSDRVAAEAVGQVARPWAAKLVAAAILVSVFSAMNGLTITTPRMYYQMAQDGLFFKKLAEVHPRFGTPAVAIVIGSVWAMVLTVWGTFESLLTYVVFVGWIFYALGALCVMVERRREEGGAGSFRVPGYPWTPLAFVIAAAAIVVNTILTQPGRSALGIAGVLVGVPVYLLWKRALPKSERGTRSAEP